MGCFQPLRLQLCALGSFQKLDFAFYFNRDVER